MPRTQNPVQYWQLRSRLSVEQAAQRIGISAARCRAVVVCGKGCFNEEEVQRSSPLRALPRTGSAHGSSGPGVMLESRLRGRGQRSNGRRNAVSDNAALERCPAPDAEPSCGSNDSRRSAPSGIAFSAIDPYP